VFQPFFANERLIESFDVDRASWLVVLASDGMLKRKSIVT
jgi:hypothetical protein